MDLLSGLKTPIISAPMAGGPSTPALVAGVAEAGGLGFLGSGYGAATALQAQVAHARELTSRPFGVNLFVPTDSTEADREGIESYRGLLLPLARQRQIELPTATWGDTTGFEDKVALLLAEPVAVVSFTFGLPPAEVVEQLHAAGTVVVVTVTDAAEAAAADALGVDALCVQAATAGGHRSTHSVAAAPNDLELVPLLQQVRSVTSLPLIGAGGISTPQDVRAALDAGAAVAQAGSAFLRTPESGATPAYKDALADQQRGETVVTRAFTGRPARMLRNSFTDRFGPQAPAAFPMVQEVIAPLRAAATAAGDTDNQPLYAGTGHLTARDVPAAEIVRYLAG